MQIATQPQIATTVPANTVQVRAGDAVRGWQVGQILTATVARSQPEGRVALDIDGRIVTARTAVQVGKGEQLSLRVETTGAQTVLRVMPQPGSATETLVRGLRLVLPRQAPLPPLLANLAMLALTPQRLSVSLPQQVLDAVQQLYRRLPSSRSLGNAAGLRRALESSGLLFESRLAERLEQNRPPALSNDFKAALWRLMGSLRAAESPAAGRSSPLAAGSAPASNAAAAQPLPTLLSQTSATRALAELGRQTLEALARVQLNQLSSLPSEEAPRPVINIELPLRHRDSVDVLHLQIEEHEYAGSGDEKVWRVQLSLELQPLGRVRAGLSLAGRELAADLWAEQPETAQLLDVHLGELRAGLGAAGLVIGRLSCQCGPGPAPLGTPTLQPLLDVEA